MFKTDRIYVVLLLLALAPAAANAMDIDIHDSVLEYVDGPAVIGQNPQRFITSQRTGIWSTRGNYSPKSPPRAEVDSSMMPNLKAAVVKTSDSHPEGSIALGAVPGGFIAVTGKVRKSWLHPIYVVQPKQPLKTIFLSRAGFDILATLLRNDYGATAHAFIGDLMDGAERHADSSVETPVAWGDPLDLNNLAYRRLKPGKFMMGQKGPQATYAQIPRQVYIPHSLDVRELPVSIHEFQAMFPQRRFMADGELGRFLVNATRFDYVEICQRLAYLAGFPSFYEMTDITRNPEGSITNARIIETGSNGPRLPTEEEWSYAFASGMAVVDGFFHELTSSGATSPAGPELVVHGRPSYTNRFEIRPLERGPNVGFRPFRTVDPYEPAVIPIGQR